MSKSKSETPFYIPGVFIRRTFIRLYKDKNSCTEIQAETAFEALIKSGEIVKIREWGEIGIFEYKK